MHQTRLNDDIQALRDEVERLDGLRQRFAPSSARPVGGVAARVEERIVDELGVAIASLERDSMLLASCRAREA